MPIRCWAKDRLLPQPLFAKHWSHLPGTLSFLEPMEWKCCNSKWSTFPIRGLLSPPHYWVHIIMLLPCRCIKSMCLIMHNYSIVHQTIQGLLVLQCRAYVSNHQECPCWQSSADPCTVDPSWHTWGGNWCVTGWMEGRKLRGERSVCIHFGAEPWPSLLQAGIRGFVFIWSCRLPVSALSQCFNINENGITFCSSLL